MKGVWCTISSLHDMPPPLKANAFTQIKAFGDLACLATNTTDLTMSYLGPYLHVTNGQGMNQLLLLVGAEICTFSVSFVGRWRDPQSMESTCYYQQQCCLHFKVIKRHRINGTNNREKHPSDCSATAEKNFVANCNHIGKAWSTYFLPARKDCSYRWKKTM